MHRGPTRGRLPRPDSLAPLALAVHNAEGN
jgi:hypothetical protein